jgi:hypothetical protein
MKAPRANVRTVASNERRGIFFWKHTEQQYASHVTRFTPNWCTVHRWAFDGDACGACHDQRATTRRTKGTQHGNRQKPQQQRQSSTERSQRHTTRGRRTA